MNLDAAWSAELTLTHGRVRLRPLRRDDREALLVASGDGALWRLPFTVIPGPETVDAYLDKAMAGRDCGSMIPFATTVDGALVGSTRFYNIDRPNRSLDIGHSWIASSWQRSLVNSEAKRLMLTHAFEAMGCLRVAFTADERNLKSQAAIERLGAIREGLLRKERIMPNGFVRNSVRYSIIDDEWPAVKRRLDSLCRSGG